ncbi:hypothetical protein CH373_07285 [Leptospira perolatii]|uniref:Phosphatase n=1 Tax=Leptospira perolatii TaxID=2023191 RepID=A0A2M9ZPL9_9LEPT|nr:alkaline phosphatase PhoX [Leptospira perolatii]PJZ70722.1 hypothetical protein CH360_04145 [Leptospira perolatii]PJZ73931.1 hypothetical protein CH373_07285 [Leptospira perolatii]
MKVTRSEFLRYVGKGALALAAVKSGSLLSKSEILTSSFPIPTPRSRSRSLSTALENGLPFTPIRPNTEDDLILPEGFQYDIIALFGDRVNRKGDTFGFNADFNCFLPFPGKKDSGLLWTNHEYLRDLEYYVNGFDYKKSSSQKRTDSQIETYLYNLGGSVTHLRKVNGIWKLDPDSKFGRRIHGRTPIRFAGPASGSEALDGKTETYGTFGNCSGGITLWDTVLSCEENVSWMIEDCYLTNPKEYGWVVEVDPFSPDSTPIKHTALGRFEHENTALTLSKSGRLVVYMGDDSKDQYVYKYVSNGTYDPDSGKLNSSLLDSGTLFAANFEFGKWIALDYEKNQDLRNAKAKNGNVLFKNQADVLVHCRLAAECVGATPMDRPEDLEIHPIDKSIYVSFTNNDKHGNLFGQIVRIVEKDHDHEGIEFEFEVFAAGGGKSGFASPDNLAFDRLANLWMVTDITTKLIGNHQYAKFGNNGLFYLPTAGRHQGKAFQFASAPVGSELTGPWFAEKDKVLFLSVQHPGETTKDYSNPSSRWPRRKKGDIPRPGVVAIRRS